MGRRITGITLDNLDDVPEPCRHCTYWELGPSRRSWLSEAESGSADKEAWISGVLLEWGCCGQLIYVDGVPAGFVLYAPPAYVPRANAFPTSPISAEAVLLMTARVLPGLAGGGLGRVLLQHVAKDLLRRDVRAIEAFGAPSRSGVEPAPSTAAGELPPPVGCVVPSEYLLAVGFKTVRPHPRYPRLRLDLRTALSWRTDVEVALERLLGSVHPDPALRPV
ncbi:MAG: GNAT family N-acetyltransferase [Actinomycetota bacterium]|nr:GNAT family N-acetyltransferase [Actinomycetota bacterium]MDP9460339.1 GNAT family N-acetyltransferase [Actinomycetota bacterium]